MNDMKIGQEFWVCNPWMGWKTNNGLGVWFALHYGHFKIKKINVKSFIVEDIKEIGCGWSSKWSMDETYTKKFWSKTEMIETIKVVIPLRINEMEQIIKQYTKFAPEYHFGKGKIKFLKEFLELTNDNLSEQDIELFNKKWKKECKKIEKKISKLK